MAYIFVKKELEEIDSCLFNNFPNKSILTTKEWIGFIAEDSKAKPYILEISKDGEFIGFFQH